MRVALSNFCCPAHLAQRGLLLGFDVCCVMRHSRSRPRLSPARVVSSSSIDAQQAISNGSRQTEGSIGSACVWGTCHTEDVQPFINGKAPLLPKTPYRVCQHASARARPCCCCSGRRFSHPWPARPPPRRPTAPSSAAGAAAAEVAAHGGGWGVRLPRPRAACQQQQGVMSMERRQSRGCAGTWRTRCVCAAVLQCPGAAVQARTLTAGGKIRYRFMHAWHARTLTTRASCLPLAHSFARTQARTPRHSARAPLCTSPLHMQHACSQHACLLPSPAP